MISKMLLRGERFAKSIALIPLRTCYCRRAVCICLNASIYSCVVSSNDESPPSERLALASSFVLILPLPIRRLCSVQGLQLRLRQLTDKTVSYLRVTNLTLGRQEDNLVNWMAVLWINLGIERNSGTEFFVFGKVLGGRRGICKLIILLVLEPVCSCNCSE